MIKPRDDGERLNLLMSALAENVACLSDREVAEDAKAQGLDTTQEVDRVRGVLLAGVLQAKKEHLRRAEVEYVEAALSFQRRAAELPADSATRRALLARTVQRRPQYREAVITLQHRDFESFSDADVESALRQLLYLGAIEEDDEEPEA